MQDADTPKPTGVLYLVPASLGDAPWELTFPAHARNIVCDLDCFVVENAKTARAQLKRIGYPRPLQSVEILVLPKNAADTDSVNLLQPLIAGRSIGLMSEAGCPAVADPGAVIVRAAHQHGIRVVPLVGPSAILLALMASGLNGQRFAFHGYLPVSEADRNKAILDLEAESSRLDQTQVAIETPYRNDSLFRSVLNVCRPDTLLCIATDITTASETITTRSIAAWRSAARPELAKRPSVFLLLAQR